MCYRIAISKFKRENSTATLARVTKLIYFVAGNKTKFFQNEFVNFTRKYKIPDFLTVVYQKFQSKVNASMFPLTLNGLNPFYSLIISWYNRREVWVLKVVLKAPVLRESCACRLRNTQPRRLHPTVCAHINNRFSEKKNYTLLHLYYTI